MNTKNKILHIKTWISNYVNKMLNPAKSLVIGIVELTFQLLAPLVQ